MAYKNTSIRKLLGVLAIIALQCCLANAADCEKRPPKVNPTTCCAFTNIMTDEIMEKCKAAMPTPPPRSSSNSGSSEDTYKEQSISDESRPPHGHHGRPHHGPHHGGHHGPHHGGPFMHPCLMSCFFNETGIMSSGSDAKLNEDKLSAYLKVVLKNDTDMIPLTENAFKTCAAKAVEFEQKMKERMEKKNGSTNDRMLRPQPPCSPASGFMMRCVFKESFVNCPTAKWTSSNECNEMRDHMKNCKPKFGDKSEVANLVE